MRFWQVGTSFAQTDDGTALDVLDPGVGWVELADQDAYDAAAAAVVAAATPSTPVTTALLGNAQSHSTSPSARRVTVHVIAPVGGPLRARPTVDGAPAVGGSGPLVYDWPGHSLEVVTRAGNNDVLVIEEF